MPILSTFGSMSSRGFGKNSGSLPKEVPTFVSASNGFSSGVALPARAVGDLMVYVGDVTNTLNGTGGWTFQAMAAPFATQGFFWKFVTGSEGSTAPKLTTSTSISAASILCFRGVNIASPINVVGAYSTTDAPGDTNQRTVVVPGVTTSIEKCLLISATRSGIDSGTGSASATSANGLALAERVDYQTATSDGGGIHVVTSPLNLPTSTGNITHTYTIVDSRPNGWQFALAPA